MYRVTHKFPYGEWTQTKVVNDSTVYSLDVDCVGVGLVFQNQLLQEEEGLLVVSLQYKR